MKIKAGVIGATGYAGAELCRLLSPASGGGAFRDQLREF